MDQKINSISGVIKRVFNNLSSRPSVAGLEVSESAILFARIDNNTPKTFSVKLPPGVVKESRIEDPGQFSKALAQLRQMVGGNEEEFVPVTVSLPQKSVFIQSFSVPNIGKEKLEEEARLNLQMISPMKEDISYSDWQNLGATEDKWELLGAFVGKETVDIISKALNKNGFSVFAFEFPGLAITRLINSTIGDHLGDEPIVVLRISVEGINFVVLKNKGLYFDYSRTWASVQGEDKKIPVSAFENAIREEVRKVVNFSTNKFKENINKVILMSPSFEEKIQKILSDEFGLSVLPYQISQWQLSSNWYSVLGSSIRSVIDLKMKDINLSPIKSNLFFFLQHLLSFIKLWRGITWAAIGAMLVVFFVSHQIISAQLDDMSKQMGVISTPPPYKEEVDELEEKAREFNFLISEFERVYGESKPWGPFFSELITITKESNIEIVRINLTSLNETISLTGIAPSEELILEFKEDLADSQFFTNVVLRVTEIITLPNRNLSFRISFNFIGSN